MKSKRNKIKRIADNFDNNNFYGEFISLEAN